MFASSHVSVHICRCPVCACTNILWKARRELIDVVSASFQVWSESCSWHGSVEVAGEVAWALHAGELILRYRAVRGTGWYITAWVPSLFPAHALQVDGTGWRTGLPWAALCLHRASYKEPGAWAAGSCLLACMGAVRNMPAVA